MHLFVIQRKQIFKLGEKEKEPVKAFVTESNPSGKDIFSPGLLICIFLFPFF